MLPILVSSLQWMAVQHDRPLRIVYVMTDGAALPLTFSQHVRNLKQLGWLIATVTVGHAYGGDFEAINVYSGLLAARHVLHADIAIVLMGPGIVGTGTPYGFTGIEQGQIVNAAHVLDGTPIVVPRISFADDRERHRGLSHHTRTNLTSIIMRPTRTALPLFPETDQQARIERQIKEMSQLDGVTHDWTPVSLTVKQLQARLREYPRKITSMGRGMEDDPAFFLGVASAADVAWDVLTKQKMG